MTVAAAFAWPGACAAAADDLGLAEPDPPVEAAETAFECVIMPDEVVEVSSGADGLIESIHVERSDTVRAGQVLARLESGVEVATVVLARERAGLESLVNLRQAALAVDRRRHERSQTLHQRNVISSDDLDRTEKEAAVAHWRLREAEDKRRIAALELSRAEAQLALRTVRSPLDGVVIERFKSAGEYVEEEPIVRVARLDPLRVEVIVPVTLRGQVTVGMSAEIFPETDVDTVNSATVTLVDPVADPASGTFGVRLELPNPGNALLAGINCTARFLEAPAKPRLAAPGSAEPDARPAARSPAPSRAALPGPGSDRVDRAPGGSDLFDAQSIDPENADPGRLGPEPMEPGQIEAGPGAPGLGRPGVDGPGVAGRRADGPGRENPGPAEPRLVGPERLTPHAGRATGDEEIAKRPPAVGAMASEDAAGHLSACGSDGAAQPVETGAPTRADAFIVLAEPGPGGAGSHDQIARLRARGISDVVTIHGGPHLGRISLGVYAGPNTAQRRQSDLADLGVMSEVAPLSGNADAPGMDAGPPPVDPAHSRPARGETWPAVTVHAAPCASILAARG